MFGLSLGFLEKGPEPSYFKIIQSHPPQPFAEKCVDLRANTGKFNSAPLGNDMGTSVTCYFNMLFSMGNKYEIQY